MKKHIWIAGALMVLFSSCNDFLDYNENSDYDQNSVFNITWSNEDFVTGIYAYLPVEHLMWMVLCVRQDVMKQSMYGLRQQSDVSMMVAGVL